MEPPRPGGDNWGHGEQGKREGGRDEQLEAIFRAQAADLYRSIYRQVRQAAAAEDLTSAVFLKALRWLQEDRGPEPVKGWLYATARSLVADYWHEHAQLPEVPLEAAEALPAETDAGAEREAHMASLQARLQHLLEGLPEREREILTLRYLQGYTPAEIGALFGLSASYVRVLQFRALRRAAALEASEGTVSMTSPTLPHTHETQRALELAREEARSLHHNYVGTEHLLLGILREDSAPGAQTLLASGVTAESMRTGIAFILARFAGSQPGATPPQLEPETLSEEPGLTRRAEQVVTMAGEEAQREGDATISPQHLLVAVLREGQGIAAMLLQVSGVRWEPEGHTLRISVISDDAGKPVAVPAELQAALEQHPDEQRIFEKLAGFKQQQLVGQVERAQGEDARKQAVQRALEILHQAHENYLHSQR